MINGDNIYCKFIRKALRNWYAFLFMCHWSDFYWFFLLSVFILSWYFRFFSPLFWNLFVVLRCVFLIENFKRTRLCCVPVYKRTLHTHFIHSFFQSFVFFLLLLFLIQFGSIVKAYILLYTLYVNWRQVCLICICSHTWSRYNINKFQSSMRIEYNNNNNDDEIDIKIKIVCVFHWEHSYEWNAKKNRQLFTVHTRENLCDRMR